jgi:tetratricopeptide (TPR) repeat protein
LTSCLVLGPTPVADALEQANAFVQHARDAPLLEAYALEALGMLRAMNGDVDEGRELLRRGWRTIRDAGHLLNAAGTVQRFAFVERRAGGPDVEQRIEAIVREGFEQLQLLDDRSFLPTVALDLAQCVMRQGRVEEAKMLCTFARERSLPDDSINFVYLDIAEAHIAAGGGRHEEAERLARRGVELADRTDFFAVRGMRRRGSMSEVLWLAGKEEEATTVASEALAFHEAKGDVTGVAALREQLVRGGVEVA